MMPPKSKIDIQIPNLKFVIGILFVICHLSFVIAAPAVASYISLNTSLTSRAQGDKLTVSVSVVNKGDESAYNVQAEVKLGNRQAMGEKKTELPINGDYRAQFTFPLSYPRAGTYPLILVMHYTDANQYPFSALTCQTFAYKKEAAPEIFGQLKPTQFSGGGTVKLILKNMGESEIKAASRLILSRELTVKNGRSETALGSRSQKELDFDVSNFSALAGSTYQAFAITEYEKGDYHFTVVSPGTISIVEKSLFKEYQIYFYAVIAVLLVLFIAFQFKK